MINQIIIIDNFLTKSEFEELKGKITSDDQPWYFNENISIENEGDPKKFYGFFCDIVQEEYPEQYCEVNCSPLIFSLNEKIKKTFGFNKVLRTRLDMTTYRGEKSVLFGPHIDLDGQHFTSIFYLTSCDAPTIIYKEKLMYGDINFDNDLNILEKIESKENRLVVFDGNYIHTGMSSTDLPRRILVNSNFI